MARSAERAAGGLAAPLPTISSVAVAHHGRSSGWAIELMAAGELQRKAEELSRTEGPVPVGLEQVETVGWRAVRDGDVQVARRALAKAPPGSAVDPFLAPSVDLLDDRADAAVAGFVAAYTAKPEGPSSLLPATLLGKYGAGVDVARRLLEAPGAAAPFAVGGLQGHLHYAGYYVASANVGELLHDDARANQAQVAFEVACAWSRAERPDAPWKRR